MVLFPPSQVSFTGDVKNPLVEVGFNPGQTTGTIWGGSVPLEDPSFLVVQRCGEAWEACIFPGE